MEQGDGLQDKDPVIYKVLIMNLLEYNELKTMEESMLETRPLNMESGKLESNIHYQLGKEHVALINITKGFSSD